MPYAVAALAVGAYTADQQSDAAKDAANAQGRANDAAIEEQRAAREEYQTNIAPYLAQGGGALSTLARLNAGDMTAFQQDPGYQFSLDQALEAVRNRGAAAGNYGGGGTTSDLLRVATGLANQGYGDFYNRRYNLAALGQNAAAGAGTASMNTASNIGNLLSSTGQAQGNAAINSANAWSNFGGQLGTLAGNYFNGYSQAQPQVVNPNSAGTVSNFGNNMSNFTGRIYG